MRTLVVATQVRLPDTHGGSTHVGELVNGLRRHGPVQVLAKRGSTARDVVPLSLDMGFPAVIKHVMPRLYFPQALLAARRFKPDAIYERASSYGLGMLLSKALNVPMLAMVLDEHYAHASLRQARYVVATDSGVVPVQYHHKFEKVSWGANAEHFRPGLDGAPVRERFGLGGKFVACYVGSFKRWHGLEVLVEAAAKLDDPNVAFLMIGDGPLREDITAAARAAGVAQRFAFTGAVPYADVPAHVAASDLCVAPFQPAFHPRSADGFVLDPLKVFEYLAMAKPTITIQAENIARLFGDGAQLLLVEPGNAAQLADAIARFRDDPDLARATAESGRERVLAHHTWQAHADHLHRLFQTMVGKKA